MIPSIAPSARPRVAVLGAGNWGTTLAHVAATNECEVRLWSVHEAQVREINDEHTNRQAVPDLELSRSIEGTSRLEHALHRADVVLMVVPSQAVREVSRAMSAHLDPAQIVLQAAKGIELGSKKRLTDVVIEETCARKIGVLSGPNIAPEIARGEPAGTVIATRIPAVVRWGRRVLSCPSFMVFSSTDIAGVELCGALKNVVAIAAGIADEMGLGVNAKALLFARGLAEMGRIAAAMGARASTISGLAGMGDLVATCSSTRSRNHRMGEELARGASLEEAGRAIGMVAEGVTTTKVARVLITELGLRCPLYEYMHRVLYEGLSPAVALQELLAMPAGRDVVWT